MAVFFDIFLPSRVRFCGRTSINNSMEVVARRRLRAPPIRILTSLRSIGMGQDPWFEAFLIGLRSGDEEAARECHDRFREAVISQIARRLAAYDRLQWRIDPADIWQDAFTALVIGIQQPRGFQIDSERKLFNLLLTIALNRLARAIDYWHAPLATSNATPKPPWSR